MSNKSKRIKLRGVLEGPFGTAESPQVRLGRPTVRRRRRRHHVPEDLDHGNKDGGFGGVRPQQRTVEVPDLKEGADRTACGRPGEVTAGFSFKRIKLRGMLGGAPDYTEQPPINLGRPKVRRVHHARGGSRSGQSGVVVAEAGEEQPEPEVAEQRAEGSDWLALVTFIMVFLFVALLLVRMDWQRVEFQGWPDPARMSEPFPPRH